MLKQKLFHLSLLLSLINFLIAAFLGVLLRLQPIVQLEGFMSRNVIHAHSHVAFLGWVFLVLIAFIYKNWLPDSYKVNTTYSILLAIIQLSTMGMLATFPFTGYALWSILFSTLHMLASLYFIYFFVKYSFPIHVYSKRFVLAGLYFMALSSLGPLALGPLTATGHKMDMWYNLAIYFYLHFQYNGWFTLVIIGLIVFQLPEYILLKEVNKIRASFWWLVAGVVLTYLLSALGYKVSMSFNILGGVGAVFQIIGLYLLIPIFKTALRSESHSFIKQLLGMVFILLAGKVLAQLLSAFPVMVDFTYYNRDFIIAYLHWVLLGFVSLFLIYLILKETFLIISKVNIVIPVWLFIVAFFFMEAILLFRALYPEIWTPPIQYFLHSLLLIDAIILAFSILLIFVNVFNRFKHNTRREFPAIGNN